MCSDDCQSPQELDNIHQCKCVDICFVCMYRTLDKGPSKTGTTSQQRTLNLFPITVLHSLTSEKRTASQMKAKWLASKCPLFSSPTFVEVLCLLCTLCTAYCAPLYALYLISYYMKCISSFTKKCGYHTPTPPPPSIKINF